jgi:hypothetical protein
MADTVFTFTVATGLEYAEDGYFLRYVVTIRQGATEAEVVCTSPTIGEGRWLVPIADARALYATGLRLNRLRTLGAIPERWSASLTLPDGSRPEPRQ